jgi:signal transduction histidine kinase
LHYVQRREEAARRTAEEAVRLRDGFLAAAAHDLSNPLTAILGTCQLLTRRVQASHAHDPDRCGLGFAGIESNAQRLAAQIEQLLDVACAEAGRPLGLRRTPVDLVALVRRVVGTRSAGSLRHEIRVETDLEKLVGSYDLVRLERVVDNLLINAVKYSPLGGNVTLTLRREHTSSGVWAVLAVSDEGVGVPTVDLLRIFEPFRRAGNVGPISGTGIGLASARQIVEEHGGRMSVASREGVGSTFTVHVPVGSYATERELPCPTTITPCAVGRDRNV